MSICKRPGMKINSQASKVVQSAVVATFSIKSPNAFSPNKHENYLIREFDLISLQLITRHYHLLEQQQSKSNYRMPCTEYFRTYFGVMHNVTVRTLHTQNTHGSCCL